MRLISRWQNSAGERVRIALHLKHLDFTYVAAGSLAADDYRALNPQGLLPALLVGDQLIAQSSAILEYLEERHPGTSLLPADPVLRGQARAFGAFITAEMHATTVQRMRRFLRAELNVDAAGEQHWVRHWLTLGFTALETTLADRPRQWSFCFGDRPGWADLHLIPQLANARRLGCDVTAYARLLAVEANCVGLRPFQLARPDAQPDYPAVAP